MTDNAEPFQKMAESIRHNAEKSFGGALVILPPGQNVSPTEMLLLDSRQDQAQFFGLVKSMAELALAEISLREQQQRGYVR